MQRKHNLLSPFSEIVHFGQVSRFRYLIFDIRFDSKWISIRQHLNTFPVMSDINVYISCVNFKSGQQNVITHAPRTTRNNTPYSIVTTMQNPKPHQYTPEI